MTTAGEDVQTAIVLQGGGALGAYEYGVLRALYEQRPGFRPVAVAGISIGAITAAVLGGPRTDPIARARRAVARASSRSPADRARAVAARAGRPGAGRRSATRACTSCAPGCSPRPGCSRASMTPHHCDRRSPSSSTRDDSTTTTTRVIVGATTSPPARWSTSTADHPGGLTFEHVAASGSLPPSFPMTDIDGEPVLGRGPVLQHPARPGDQRAGAGGGRRPRRGARAHRRRAVPDAGRGAADLHDVVQRMMQLQYTSRLTLDARFFDKISKIVDLVDRGGCDVAAGQRRSATTRLLPGGAGVPPDRSPQRRHLEPAPGAVQRRGLLAGVGGGPDPGGVRRRDRAGHRQPVEAPGLRFGVTGGADAVQVPRAS